MGVTIVLAAKKSARIIRYPHAKGRKKGIKTLIYITQKINQRLNVKTKITKIL